MSLILTPLTLISPHMTGPRHTWLSFLSGPGLSPTSCMQTTFAYTLCYAVDKHIQLVIMTPACESNDLHSEPNLGSQNVFTVFCLFVCFSKGIGQFKGMGQSHII